MANIPSNIDTGVVTGQFLVGIADGTDADLIPDASPATGTITFTPSVKSIRNPTGSPNAQTILLQPVIGVIDAEGYLCNNVIDPITFEYQRGVPLIATSITNVTPDGWTWKVSYNLQHNGSTVVGPATHSLQILPEEIIDLTVAAPVTESGGVITVQGPQGEPGPEGPAGSGGGLPSGGTALQLIRKDATNTTTEWITPTKSMVGLDNVDNTSDLNKPVSNATQTALNAKAPSASPTFTGTVSGITKVHVGLGNVDNTSDASKPVSTATQTALNAKAPVDSPTFTGTVAGVTKVHVGLDNVDNTSDANKPISTATQSALDGKAASSHTHTLSQISDASTLGRQIAATADASSARTLIGAGTSNLALGTTGSTAKAGNYAPSFADAIAGSSYHVYWTGTAWPARPTARTDLIVIWTAPRSVTDVPVDKVDGRDIREFSGD